MKSCLLTVSKTFSRELAHHLAARLGEREAAVSKALQGLVPMVFCQLIVRAGDGEGPALHQLLRPHPNAPAQSLENVTELLALLGSGAAANGPLATGQRLLKQLFRAKLPAVQALVSDYAGLQSESAGTLLELVAAAQAALLGEQIRQEQLTAAQLSRKLGEAKNLAYGVLPADLPRWPGFRRRGAVRTPHALLVAELGRPYWVLMLAAVVVALLAFVVLSYGGPSPAGPLWLAADGTAPVRMVGGPLRR